MPNFATLKPVGPTPTASAQPNFATLKPVATPTPATSVAPQQSFADSIWSGLVKGATAVTNAAGLGGVVNEASNALAIPMTPLNAQKYLPQTNPEQAIGAGLEIAPYVVGAPEIAGAKAPAGIIKGAIAGAKAGAIGGSIAGASSGAGQAMSQNGSLSDIAQSTAIGGATGAAGGGIIGGALGGVAGGLEGRALRQQQLTEQLKTNPELVAKYNLNDNGQIVKDPKASELVRQGIPESQVAVVKNATPTDKQAFSKMINLAESAQQNARQIERPSDVVGQTIVDRTKHLVSTLNTTGKQLDGVAQTLKGQSVDLGPAYDKFTSDLQRIGVTFDHNGVPNFEGSDIQGIAPAENLITKLVNRIGTPTNNGSVPNLTDYINSGDKLTQNGSAVEDAFKGHQVKRFIDEQVNYAKEGEGLSGQTANIVKSLRHNIDTTLDSNFPAYNAVNTKYAEARNLIEDTKSVLGRNFDPQNAVIRAASVARRVLGNSANRGDILDYIKNLDTFYKANGGTGKGDILTQTVFADILEGMYGTQATTGLSGQVARGVQEATGVGKDLLKGNVLGAAAKTASHAYEAIQNISPEAQKAALKALVNAK